LSYNWRKQNVYGHRHHRCIGHDIHVMHQTFYDRGQSSLGHYNYIFQIVWALLGETELGWIEDFSIKLSSAQKTVSSLVRFKIVRRWRYHKRNSIWGVAHTPYASWDSIKCNNTWGVPQKPYG
jgi:hypothetical protein